MGGEQTMARQIDLKWEVLLGRGKGERGREEKETEREREEETGKALSLQRNSRREIRNGQRLSLKGTFVLV